MRDLLSTQRIFDLLRRQLDLAVRFFEDFQAIALGRAPPRFNSDLAAAIEKARRRGSGGVTQGVRECMCPEHEPEVLDLSSSRAPSACPMARPDCMPERAANLSGNQSVLLHERSMWRPRSGSTPHPHECPG